MRRGRASIEGQWYLLTFCCHERCRHFDNSRAAAVAAALLASTSLWRRSRLRAWVLMPDHFHALLQLHAESLGKLANRAKSVSSAAVRREIDLPTPLWMRGFHDRALGEEESLELAEQYILLNPMRAGLGEAYPYRGIVA